MSKKELLKAIDNILIKYRHDDGESELRATCRKQLLSLFSRTIEEAKPKKKVVDYDEYVIKQGKSVEGHTRKLGFNEALDQYESNLKERVG